MVKNSDMIIDMIKKIILIALFIVFTIIAVVGYKHGPLIAQFVSGQFHFSNWQKTLVETEYGKQYGNPDAQTVFLHSQGGPSPELEGLESYSPLWWIDLKNSLVVDVHQMQTKQPEIFSTDVIEFQEAIEYDKQGTQLLAEVVETYKKAGKTVYVLGESFGAFVVTDLLASQGNIADGYIITAGRLNMEAEIWQEFAKGKGNTVVIENEELVEDTAQEADAGEEWTNEDINMDKLAAGLGHKRYTELLANTDLSNVVYVYGTKDESVGPLTQQEKDFLHKQGAHVVEITGGTHSEVMSRDVLKNAFSQLSD